jgi:hypothetical protein
MIRRGVAASITTVLVFLALLSAASLVVLHQWLLITTTGSNNDGGITTTITADHTNAADTAFSHSDSVINIDKHRGQRTTVLSDSQPGKPFIVMVSHFTYRQVESALLLQ